MPLEARAAQSVITLENTKELCGQYENYTIASGRYSCEQSQASPATRDHADEGHEQY